MQGFFNVMLYLFDLGIRYLNFFMDFFVMRLCFFKYLNAVVAYILWEY